MAHYKEDQWVDYARGLADSCSRIELQEHLESGCSECRDTMKRYESVARVAARDLEHEPPPYAVRSALAYFSLQQAQRESSPTRFLEFTMVFDSFAESARVGTRSLDSTSRQMVYYGNDYALTLRMDLDAELSLGGELLHREKGPVSNVPALLMSGQTVLSYSLSGELGDFHMTCGHEGPLRLRMLVNDDDLIEIDLEWPQDLVQDRGE